MAAMATENGAVIYTSTTPTHIDLSHEKDQWARAVYGKEVRSATVRAYTKIEEQLNDTVDKVMVVAGGVSDMTAAAERAVTEMQETATDAVERAEVAAQEAAERAEAAAQETAERAEAAAQEATESANEATTAANEATAAANEATQRASTIIAQAETTVDSVVAEARRYADLSESWAVGNTGVRAGEGLNNSQYFSQLASAEVERARDHANRAMTEANRARTEADRAAAIAGVGIATYDSLGLIKPDGVTTIVNSEGILSTKRFYEERIIAESVLDMDHFAEPGFYQIDYVTVATATTNIPFSNVGFLLIVGKGGAFMDGYTEDVIFQEAISYGQRKYRTYCQFQGWSAWQNTSIGLANALNQTTTGSALDAVQGKVLKDSITAHKGDTTVHITGEERTKWNGAIDSIATLNRKTTGKLLFSGSLDVGGGVQTLRDDITQHNNLLCFVCASGDNYYHGTMAFTYTTGMNHTIPIGKGYLTVTSASGTEIEVLENTTGYALRQIWGLKS